MKKALFLYASLLALTGFAHAADTVDLKVTGTIANGACTPKIENGGVIDLGSVPTKSLIWNETNQGYQYKNISHKEIDVDISCTVAVTLGFGIIDNKASVTPAELIPLNGHFGFASSEDGTGVGAYQLYAKSGTAVDGTASDVLWSGDKGGVWNKAQALNSGTQYLFAFAKSGEKTPMSGKEFHLAMDSDYYFSKAVVDAITDSLDYEGSATFTLAYL
ncbi:DUF1120 domain-containing protein [Cronobacter malonaticus]